MHPNDLNAKFDLLDPLDKDDVDIEDSADEDSNCADAVDSDRLDVNELHWIDKMFHGAARVAMAIADAAGQVLQGHSQTHYNKQPYYTSALSVMAWVNELLARHPDHIRCELGMQHHVFYCTIEYTSRFRVQKFKTCHT